MFVVPMFVVLTFVIPTFVVPTSVVPTFVVLTFVVPTFVALAFGSVSSWLLNTHTPSMSAEIRHLLYSPLLVFQTGAGLNSQSDFCDIDNATLLK